MDKPAGTSLVHEEIYNAPVSQVWEALTDEAAMRDWYFPQLINFKPEVGYDFVFTNDGSPYQKAWQVTQVEEGKIFAHTWIYKGYTGKSEVIFTLFEEGEKTKLELTHTGLESFPPDPHFAMSRFENGWAQILGENLKVYLAKKYNS